jgi:hypothetical protein
LFGRDVFAETIDLAAEQTGKTMIYGAKDYDHLGFSVAAGHLDGDNFADLLIGAANVQVGGLFSVGEAVVLRGSPEITPTAVLFYHATARRGSVTLEWGLLDDVRPGDIRVTRTPGPRGLPAGTALDAEIIRLNPGHYALTDSDVDGGSEYVYETVLQDDPPQILFRVTVTVPRFADARLHPAAPNPFRHDTNIAFEIPAAGRVQARVYDVTGALVAVLADNEFPAGMTRLNWDGRDKSGAAAASGVYFVRMNYGKQSLERKILIVR